MNKAKRAPIRKVIIMLGPAIWAALPMMANITPPIAVPTPRNTVWARFSALRRGTSTFSVGNSLSTDFSLAVSFLAQPDLTEQSVVCSQMYIYMDVECVRDD